MVLLPIANPPINGFNHQVECPSSFQILNLDQKISEKLLTKAASKLGVTSLILEKCLISLAAIFLKASMMARLLSQTKSSFEMLGIPHAEDLANFWFNEVHNSIRK